jgi:hypothetical protein
MGESVDPAKELVSALEGVGGSLGSIAQEHLKQDSLWREAFGKNIDTEAVANIAKYSKKMPQEYLLSLRCFRFVL